MVIPQDKQIAEKPSVFKDFTVLEVILSYRVRGGMPYS